MHPQVGKIGVFCVGGERRPCVIIWREGIYAGVRWLPGFEFMVVHADQVLFRAAAEPDPPVSPLEDLCGAVRKVWKAMRFDPRKTFAEGPPVTSMGIVGWFRLRFRWYRAVALTAHGTSVFVRRAPDLEAFEVPLRNFVPADCIEHVLPTLPFLERLTLTWCLRFAAIPYKPASQASEQRLPRRVSSNPPRSRDLPRPK